MRLFDAVQSGSKYTIDKSCLVSRFSKLSLRSLAVFRLGRGVRRGNPRRERRLLQSEFERREWLVLPKMKAGFPKWRFWLCRTRDPDPTEGLRRACWPGIYAMWHVEDKRDGDLYIHTIIPGGHLVGE